MKIKVTGQGGLPNMVSTRLDIPSYVERCIRAAYRTEVVILLLRAKGGACFWSGLPWYEYRQV